MRGFVWVFRVWATLCGTAAVACASDTMQYTHFLDGPSFFIAGVLLTLSVGSAFMSRVAANS